MIGHYKQKVEKLTCSNDVHLQKKFFQLEIFQIIYEISEDTERKFVTLYFNMYGGQ